MFFEENEVDLAHFNQLMKEAEKGNANAQYELGCLYIEELGDIEPEGPDDDPLYEMNEYYACDDIDVSEKSECVDNGLYWFTEAAKLGHLDAQASLSYLYQNGICYRGSGYDSFGYPNEDEVLLNINDVKAEYWYQRAAEQGYTNEEYEIKRNKRRDNRNKIEERQLIEQGAAKGDPEAQYQLGMILYSDTISVRDYKEVMNLFTQSAENGYVKSQAILGDIYRSGISKEVARKEYLTSFSTVGMDCEDIIEYIKEDVTYVEKDYGKSLYWYTKAAQQGDPHAQHCLATWDDSGTGV